MRESRYCFVTLARSTARVAVAASKPGAGAATTVVALPGWKGTDIGVKSLQQGVVHAGFQVLTCNLPGNGISPTSPFPLADIDELAADIDEAVERLIDRGCVILLGHSFGATVATAVAARRPQWLSGLVVVSPVVRAPRERGGLLGFTSRLAAGFWANLLAKAPRTLADAALRSLLIELLTNGLYARRGVRGLRRIMLHSKAEWAYRADPRAMSEQLRIASSVGCLDFVEDVEVPTWIVSGDRDQMSSPRDLEMFRAGVRDGHLKLVPGAGHLGHHEDSQTFSALVAECVAALATQYQQKG